MDQHDWLAEQFEANRSHLRSVACRMLGSLARRTTRLRNRGSTSAALETLAPHERLAFVLRDLFGVPFDEIAAAIQSSTRPMAAPTGGHRTTWIAPFSDR